jgi:ARS binding protein 2
VAASCRCAMDEHYNQSPEDDDESLVRHLASHNHQHTNSQSSTTPSFSHTEYRHPSVPTIDPALEGEALAGSNGGSSNLDVHNTFSPTATHNNGTLNPQQFPRQLYTDMARTALSPSTPTESSPAITTRFPNTPQNQKQLLPAYTPSDRSLPSRDVTDANIDNAYVAFILYCNPSVPLSTDTSELRRGFRAPPKSDGKSFNTFTLLELIRKFENKEIRTWTSLAIQLGVEPPMVAKNQSAQKVQQYAVRLKVSTKLQGLVLQFTLNLSFALWILANGSTAMDACYAC